MSAPEVTVLLTCAGGPGMPAWLESLRTSTKWNARVVMADADAARGNLFLPGVDARRRIPPCGDPDFVAALVRLAEAEGVDFLYSGLDEELPVLARARETLAAAGCRVLLPPAEALEAALDKRAAHRALEGNVALPETFFSEDADFDPAAAWDALEGRCVVKPAASRGGRGVHLPWDREEYDVQVRRAERAGAPFLVQRRLDGDEFNVTVLRGPGGEEVLAASRRKFESREVKSTTTAAVVERDDEVIEVARRAAEGLGLAPGFSNVEVVRPSAGGEPVLLEVNGGRTAAQDMNLVASGVPLADLWLELLQGRVPDPVPHPADGLAILKIRTDVVVPKSDVDAVPDA